MTYPHTPGYVNNPNSKAMADLLEATGKANTLRHRVYKMIMSMAAHGATAEEVSIELDNYTSGVGARFRELELGGAIARNGSTRKNKNGGINLDVYVVTGKPYSPPKEVCKITRYDKGMLVILNYVASEIRVGRMTGTDDVTPYRTDRDIVNEIEKVITTHKNHIESKYNGKN